MPEQTYKAVSGTLVFTSGSGTKITYEIMGQRCPEVDKIPEYIAMLVRQAFTGYDDKELEELKTLIESQQKQIEELSLRLKAAKKRPAR